MGAESNTADDRDREAFEPNEQAVLAEKAEQPLRFAGNTALTPQIVENGAEEVQTWGLGAGDFDGSRAAEIESGSTTRLPGDLSEVKPVFVAGSAFGTDTRDTSAAERTDRVAQAGSTPETAAREPELTHLSGVRVSREQRPPEEERGIRPDIGKVQTALRAGETLTMVIERPSQGADPVVKVSKGLLPHSPIVARAAQTEIGQSNNVATPQAEAAPAQLPFWVRIVSRPATPTSTPKEGGASQSQPGLQIRDMLEDKSSSWRYQVVIQGSRVEPDRVRQLSFEALERHGEAERTWGGDQAKREEQAWLDKLAAGGSTDMVERSIVVGTENFDTLVHMTSLLTGSVLPSQGQSFHVETERGIIKWHNSREEALAAGTVDQPQATHVPVQEFRDMITYPDKEAAGWQVGKRFDFGVVQDLEPGVKAFAIGQIHDNQGNPDGEFRIPVQDLPRHIFIVGSSGSGKTVAEQEIIVGAKVDNYEARQEDPTIPLLAVVTFDAKKGGNESNFTQPVADMLDARGMPEEVATVRKIRPGEDGLRAVLDTSDPTDSSPSAQAARLIHSFLVGVGGDAESQRILERYVKDGVISAYRKSGWNMETDSSQYEADTPPHPSMTLIVGEIRRIFDEKSYDDKASGNLSEFTAGQFQSAMELIPGRMFVGGYPIDFNKVINSEGVTAFELDQMGSNDTARKVAIVCAIQEIEKVVDAENAALGRGEVKHPRVLIVLDEASNIFDLTPAGEATADFLTRLRSKGICFVIAQQGKLTELNDHVLNNTNTIVAMHINNGADRERLAEFVGDIPADELDYLATREVANGRGLAYGSGMNAPVRVQTPNPHERPPGRGTVTDASDLVKRGYDSQYYSGEVIAKADEFLKTNPTGWRVRAWAEVAAISVLTGDKPVRLKDDSRLLKSLQGEDARVVERAVTQAIKNAVDSRPDVMHAMTRRGLAEHLSRHMLGQVRGGDVPEDASPQFGLMLNIGHFGPVKKVLMQAMTAPSLPNSERFEAVIGQVKGSTAYEQQDGLDWLENQSLNSVIGVMRTASTTERVPAETVRQAAAELAKITGGSAAPEATDAVLVRIQKLQDQPLTAPQQAAFRQVVTAMADDIEKYVAAGGNSYEAMRQELRAWIRTHETTGALDLSTYEQTYGPLNTTAEGKPVASALQQLITIRQREAAYLASNRYKVSFANLLFAPDLLTGKGTTVDNIVRAFLESARPSGEIHRELAAKFDGGRPEELGFASILQRDGAADAQAKQWAQALTTYVVFSDDFDMDPVTRRSLQKGFVAEMKVMEETAEAKAKQQRERQARQGTKPPAAAA